MNSILVRHHSIGFAVLNRFGRTAIRTAAATCLAISPSLAPAQDAFPLHRIRIVAPVTAGNGSDVATRLLAKEFSQLAGQPVVVENRPGGNNAIGAQAVVNGEADGHTLFVGSNSSMAANAVVFKELGYDPIKDLTPVSMIIRARWVLVVANQSPFESIESLVAAGRKDPGALSSGDGSAGFQLATALFSKGAGVKITQALYKGTAPALQDLSGNHVSLAIVDLSSALAHIKAGRVRPLLAVSDERISVLPDVPSMKEKGFGPMPLYSWAALFVKSGTPKPRIDKLAQWLEKAMQSEAYRKYVASVNSEAIYIGPDDMKSFQANQIDSYGEAMRIAGVKPQ